MADLKGMAINLTILLMFLNAAPNLLVASGVAHDWGVTPSVGGGGAVQSANQGMQHINAHSSNGISYTLFSLYQSVTGPVKAVMGIIFGGPIMLASLGIPGWIISFLFVPQYLVVGGTIIYMLARRRL